MSPPAHWVWREDCPGGVRLAPPRAGQSVSLALCPARPTEWTGAHTLREPELGLLGAERKPKAGPGPQQHGPVGSGSKPGCSTLGSPPRRSEAPGRVPRSVQEP